MESKEEASSVLVPGLKGAETKMSESTSTAPFVRLGGSEDPPDTEMYPKDCQIVCSLPYNPRSGQDKNEENLDASNGTIHPNSLPCNRVTTSIADKDIQHSITSNETKNSSGGQKLLKDGVPSSDSRCQEVKEEEPAERKSTLMEETDQHQTPGLEVTEEPTQDPLLIADSKEPTQDPLQAADTHSAQEKGKRESDETNSLQGSTKGSINSENSEADPLLSKNTKQRQKKKLKERKQMKRFVLSVAILFSIILASTSILVLLYVFKGEVFVNTSTEMVNTLAVLGDFVLLPTHIKGSLVMYHYRIYFSVSANNITRPVNIYQFPCDNPPEKMKERPSLSAESPSMIPILERMYFGHCSNPQYDDKCILDQFFYQAKSAVSEINYNITLDNFTKGVTDVQIHAFDNYEYFMEYLKGADASKAVKTFQMNDINFLFVFNDDQMKESAYYFVAIESVEGSSKWFTVDRLGLHVYYIASSSPPICIMNSSNNYSCVTEVNNENQCFLGYVKGPKVKGLPTAGQQFHILHHVGKPMPTSEGYVVIFVGCFFPVVIIIFCCCLLYISRRAMWKYCKHKTNIYLT